MIDVQIIFKKDTPPVIMNAYIWLMARIADSYQLSDGSVVLSANVTDGMIKTLRESRYVHAVKDTEYYQELEHDEN